MILFVQMNRVQIPDSIAQILRQPLIRQRRQQTMFQLITNIPAKPFLTQKKKEGYSNLIFLLTTLAGLWQTLSLRLWTFIRCLSFILSTISIINPANVPLPLLSSGNNFLSVCDLKAPWVAGFGKFHWLCRYTPCPGRSLSIFFSFGILASEDWNGGAMLQISPIFLTATFWFL